MSELRYNIVSREWVIIATDRAKRPRDFIKQKKEQAPLPEYKTDCPFCPGNEKFSPEETFSIKGQKGWKVRAIPNKFPALSPKQDLMRAPSVFNNRINGFGMHEVIIENPRHNTAIPLMSDVEVENILKVYKSRYDSIRTMKGIQAITIFKNHGPAAGTSLEHPHSQLIATPIVPPQMRNRVDNAIKYFDIIGKCVFCSVLENELEDGKRIVLETDKFAAFLPYAGAAPFAIWIYPKRHMSCFSCIDESEIKDLARNLKGVLKKLYYGLDNPDFNYTIRSVPANESEIEYFHWYLSIIPRLSQPAGFELGSGMFINTSLPEESAEFLRQVKCP